MVIVEGKKKFSALSQHRSEWIGYQTVYVEHVIVDVKKLKLDLVAPEPEIGRCCPTSSSHAWGGDLAPAGHSFRAIRQVKSSQQRS